MSVSNRGGSSQTAAVRVAGIVRAYPCCPTDGAARCWSRLPAGLTIRVERPADPVDKRAVHRRRLRVARMMIEVVLTRMRLEPARAAVTWPAQHIANPPDPNVPGNSTLRRR